MRHNLGFRSIMWMLAALAALPAYGASSFPAKPIRILTGAVGGTGDAGARRIAEALAERGRLGQPIVVDNRPITASDMVAKAAPDGYTLLVDGGSFWISPMLQRTPYDVMRDFAAITPTTISPNVLVVTPSLPASNVKALIALARAKPGALNCGSAGVGGAAHLALELFKSMANVDIVHVAYKGAAPAITALMGGREIQMQFLVGTPLWEPHVNAGRLRALAVASLQPSPLARGLPTIAESGLPGFEAIQIMGAFAPAKTPAPVVNQLNEAFVWALSQPAVKERLLAYGLEAYTSSPREFSAVVKSEIAKWGKVIKEAGLKME